MRLNTMKITKALNGWLRPAANSARHRGQYSGHNETSAGNRRIADYRFVATDLSSQDGRTTHQRIVNTFFPSRFPNSLACGSVLCADLAVGFGGPAVKDVLARPSADEKNARAFHRDRIE
jgi:hypothetical protein